MTTLAGNLAYVSLLSLVPLVAVVEQGWRVLVVWECALRGRLKLNDRDLTERLEEWICGGSQTAQIDTQGIHPFTVSPPDTAPPQA